MEYGTKHGMEWGIEHFSKYGTYSPNPNMCIICTTALVNIWDEGLEQSHRRQQNMLSGTDTWNRNTLFSDYAAYNRSVEQIYGTHLERKCVPHIQHMLIPEMEVWSR